MIRKAAIALVILISCLSSQIYALGLGRVTVESALNQPLRARIEILQLADTRPEDINAQLASFDDFQRFNVERVGYLSDIRFRVMSDANGPYVSVSSNQLVQEPYLNFILDTRWPSGRLLSEHTLLFDLPVFSDADTVEPVVVPARGSIAANAVPVVDAEPASASQPASEPAPVQTIQRVEEAISSELDVEAAQDSAEAVAPRDSNVSANQPSNEMPSQTIQEGDAQTNPDNSDELGASDVQTETVNSEPVTQTTQTTEETAVEETPAVAEDADPASTSEPTEEAIEETVDEPIAEELADTAVSEPTEEAIEEIVDEPNAEDLADTAVSEPEEPEAREEPEEPVVAESPATDVNQQENTEEGVDTTSPAALPVAEESPSNEANELLTTDSDTLWSIALRTRPSREVSVQQTMLALQSANPEAFVDGNINRLRSGAVLRIPDLSNIRTIDQREAVAEVARQNEQADLSPAPLTALARPQEDVSSANRGELSVVTAQDSDSSGQGGSATAELDARIASLENLLMQAQEEADRARMQREELNDQLRQLDQQIGSAQELIRLQDLQLAQLQASLAERVNASLADPSDQPVEATQSSEAVELNAEQNAALQADLQQADSATRPASFTQDLTRILTGNMAFVGFAVVLVILLLVVLLLRRSRASRLKDDEEDALETSAATGAVETPDPELSESAIEGEGDDERDALDELLGLEEVVDEEFMPPEIDDLGNEDEADEFNYSQESSSAIDGLDYTLPIDGDEDDEDDDEDDESPEIQSTADESDSDPVAIPPEQPVDSAAGHDAEPFEVEFETIEGLPESEPESSPSDQDKDSDTEDSTEFDLDALDSFDESISFDEAFTDENTIDIESVEDSLDDSEKLESVVEKDVAQTTLDIETPIEHSGLDLELEDVSAADDSAVNPVIETDEGESLSGAIDELEIEAFDLDDFDIDAIEPADDADAGIAEAAEAEVESIDFDIAEPVAAEASASAAEDDQTGALTPEGDAVADTAADTDEAATVAGDDVESIDFDIADPASDETSAGAEEDEIELETFEFDVEESPAPSQPVVSEAAEGDTGEELETFDFDISDSPAPSKPEDAVAEESIDFDSLTDTESTDASSLDDEGFLDLDELVDAADRLEQEKGDKLPRAVQLEDSEVDFDLDFDSEVATAPAALDPTSADDLSDVEDLAEADDINFDLDEDDTLASEAPELNSSASDEEIEDLDLAIAEVSPAAEEVSDSPDPAEQEMADIDSRTDPSNELDFELDDEILDSGSSDSVELLGGADEADTKLELAYAYQKMGDPEGAREILEEVLAEGNKQQKAEAQKLLDAS